MRKQIRLQKKLLKSSLLALGASCAAITVYVFISRLDDAQVTTLNAARSALSFRQVELGTLRNQIENTKGAQVKYADYIQTRGNDKLAANLDDIKALLGSLRDEMDLGQDLRLTLSTEAVMTDSVYANLPHTISLRPATKINFSTITDMHGFSFVQTFAKSLSGIVEITALKIASKNKPLDAAALSQISSGGTPELVDAELVFDWYSVTPKKVDAR